MKRYYFAGFALLALSSRYSILSAAQCDQDAEPVDGMTIGKITIENKNIFDSGQPQEDRWIHQAANSLHIITTKETIENQLLFKSGQPYSSQLMAENERLLRANKYIHAVEIIPQQPCNGEVEISVISTDNWTLTPSVSVGHSGGVTRTSYELKESNFFGLGTQIKLKSETDEIRTENQFSYSDNNLFGSHQQLLLKIDSNSDGFLNAISLEQPFFHLAADSAWSISLLDSRKEEPIYDAGVVTGAVGQDDTLFNLSYGWLNALGENSVSRYRLGWSQSKTSYFATRDFPGTPIPVPKMVNYPYIQYQFIEDEYINKTNFTVMGVVEDISLGDSFTITAGWQDSKFNSSETGLILDSDYSFGTQFSNKTLGRFSMGFSGQLNESSYDPFSLNLDGRIFYFNDEDHSYQFSANLGFSGDSLSHENYLLGGDSGLKGYPVRYQRGERKAVFSIEKRNYLKWYPLRLLKLGFASFAEVGSTWKDDEQPNFIGDVGFGLRVVSTRQSDSKVLALDLAFPTSERDQVDSYQLFIKAQSQF